MRNRRDSSVVRQVLAQIINNHPTSAQNKVYSSQQSSGMNSMEGVKLKEAVKYLERKVERQNSQNKMLGDQLSKEIGLREEMARLLAEEKDKSGKLTQHLSRANNTVMELRKKVEQMECKGEEREAYQSKINRSQAIVRKKEEQMRVMQKKLDEALEKVKAEDKHHSEVSKINQQVIQLKEKNAVLNSQNSEYRCKINDLSQRVRELQMRLHESEGSVYINEEKIRRLQCQLADLGETTTRQEIQTVRLREEVEVARQETLRLQQGCQEQKLGELHWDLAIFRDEMRRVVGRVVQETNLRKKVERAAIGVVEDMEQVFASITDSALKSCRRV